MQNLALKLGQNTFILLATRAVNMLTGVVIMTLLARGLGDVGFGQYNFILAWIASVVPVAEFGLNLILTRDIAADPLKTVPYLKQVIFSKCLLGLPIVLFFLLLADWLAPHENSALAMALRWGCLFFFSGLVYSALSTIFVAHQRMWPLLWLSLLGQSSLLLGLAGLIWLHQPLPYFIAWLGLHQCGQCFLAWVFYRRLKKGLPTAYVVSPKTKEMAPAQATLGLALSTWLNITTTYLQTSKTFLAKAWPFALSGFLITLQIRGNMLILGYVQGEQALGWYALAERIMVVVRELPGAFFAAIFPLFSALVGQMKAQDLEKTMALSQGGILAFSLLAAGSLFFFAEFLLVQVFGSSYRPALKPLQMLLLAVIPATQSNLYIVYLYAQQQEKFVNWGQALGLIINFGLCFALVSGWGATGVAFALVIMYTCLCMFLGQGVYKIRNR